jgi:hypothetical protein
VTETDWLMLLPPHADTERLEISTDPDESDFELITSGGARLDAAETVAGWVEAALLLPAGETLASASPAALFKCLHRMGHLHHPARTRPVRAAAALWRSRRTVIYAVQAAIFLRRAAPALAVLIPLVV